jgi:tripartite-type tricarboxylate transporter receptor subunit TctC
MVNGFVMVGAIITNKSPVTLDQVTPIARLTGEYEAIVVPANSPIKDAKELAAALKAAPAKGPGQAARRAASITSRRHCSHGVPAPIRPKSITSRSLAAARRWRWCLAVG